MAELPDDQKRGPDRVFIVGPTASGKTDIALRWAHESGSLLINADSLQVYGGLQIGTARPLVTDLVGIKAELFGHVALGVRYTAGAYCRDVERVIERAAHERVHIFVGGSGFYLQAIEKGMFEVPEVPEALRAELVARLAREGRESLFSELKLLDPKLASQLVPEDSYRIVRALGIIAVAGRPLSQIQEEFARRPRPTYLGRQFKLGLLVERDELRTRIRERTQKMLDMGWIEEVQDLLARGFADWPPLQSVGYKEVRQYLAGNLAREDLLEAIVKSTMALAKRQMTWFRRDREIVWRSPGELTRLSFREFLPEE